MQKYRALLFRDPCTQEARSCLSVHLPERSTPRRFYDSELFIPASRVSSQSLQHGVMCIFGMREAPVGLYLTCLAELSGSPSQRLPQRGRGVSAPLCNLEARTPATRPRTLCRPPGLPRAAPGQVTTSVLSFPSSSLPKSQFFSSSNYFP